MARPAASPSRGESPARRLTAFIARFDPSVARVARAARLKLRRRFPTATELVYDNYNALAIGFGPNDRTGEAFVSLAVYARGVNLYFIDGKRLPDPDRLLEGAGNRGRFIRLAKAADVDRAPVVRLLRAAASRGKTPLPAAGRGPTIIKSVSRQQRPRRPGGMGPSGPRE